MAVQDYKKYSTGLITKNCFKSLKEFALSETVAMDLMHNVSWHTVVSDPVPTFLLSLQSTEDYFVFYFELQRRQSVETWVKQFQRYMLSLLPVINNKLKGIKLTEQQITDYFANYVCLTLSKNRIIICFLNDKDKGR